MGWSGLKNVSCWGTAEDNGIDVLLTGDGTLNHEQSLVGRRLAIVTVSAPLYRVFSSGRLRSSAGTSPPTREPTSPP